MLCTDLFTQILVVVCKHFTHFLRFFATVVAYRGFQPCVAHHALKTFLRIFICISFVFVFYCISPENGAKIHVVANGDYEKNELK